MDFDCTYWDVYLLTLDLIQINAVMLNFLCVCSAEGKFVHWWSFSVLQNGISLFLKNQKKNSPFIFTGIAFPMITGSDVKYNQDTVTEENPFSLH